VSGGAVLHPLNAKRVIGSSITRCAQAGAGEEQGWEHPCILHMHIASTAHSPLSAKRKSRAAPTARSPLSAKQKPGLHPPTLATDTVRPHPVLVLPHTYRPRGAALAAACSGSGSAEAVGGMQVLLRLELNKSSHVVRGWRPLHHRGNVAAIGMSSIC